MSKNYRVIIPEENSALLKFRQDDQPGVAVINDSLKGFEPKVVFCWHLSIMLHYKDLIENGMPSRAEREVLDPFGDMLDLMLKGEDPEKPNALFLARITWNKTRELVYRVFDPEPAHEHLRDMLEHKSYAKPFDYRIDPDPEWKLAEWHLNAGRK